MTEFIDSAGPVRAGEELDAAKLADYLTEYLPEAARGLDIQQFPSGFSNLTYLLTVGGNEYVLRRPPFGNRVKSAHDMGREFRVLSKLADVYPLAPRPVAACEDDSVLGAPFYVMERRKGVVFRGKLPKGLDPAPEVFRGLGESFIDNLADLHAINYQSAGLGDLGKPDGYIERQVSGWTKRYENAKTSDVREMHEIAGWLAAHQPPECAAALIHNDYKFDNLVLDPRDLTRIIAVLDWEMCTIGDPLMDLGCTLAYWVQADDDATLKSFVAGPTDRPGNLTRAELCERYAARTGRDASGILFHYCFGLFKLAVIVQQIYFRYAQGHTRDPRFATLDQVVVNLGRASTRAVEAGSIE